ncbi:MAG: D-alanyl-D-alanine endopeptidase [Betaproteobacteria bacterium]|nr:D-alanyl-D-alanine endopeptidase [Betaproteobacteria bacterium]
MIRAGFKLSVLAHGAAALFVMGLAAPLAHAEQPAKGKLVKAKSPSQRAAAKTPDLTKEGEPNLLSSAALVYDQNSGKLLYAKNADTVTPIASITKVMTAMIVLDAKLPLDEAITITNDDIDMLKGSRSRLPIGSAFRREDLMRLSLMASDNRAASALGRNYPGGIEAFVEAMNTKAKLLNLSSTRFVDSSGLAPGNVSSPQDLATLVSEAARYPMIREFSTTPELHVTLPNAKKPMGFNNTNALVKNQEWNIGLSKTGYISESGKCLVMQATIANNPVVIVLLDSWGRLTRIGDANRIKKWLETQKVAATPRAAS